MKKFQRIIALIGAVLLVLMYAATLIFAFIDHSSTMVFFKIALAGTFVIPVLLYGIILFTRLSNKDSNQEDSGQN